MNVIELFSSIEGEGSRQGFPCTFLRLYDCNIRCSYCDTLYSYDTDAFESFTVSELVTQIMDLGNTLVTITGGEPLLQAEEVYQLIASMPQYDFNIETNGTILPKFPRPKNVMYTYDYKLPFSTVEDSMNPDFFAYLQDVDVVKFVVANYSDLHRMKEVVAQYPTKAQLFISPVFGEIQPVEIVRFMQENRLQNMRLQLQIHKIIWDPDKKGV